MKPLYICVCVAALLAAHPRIALAQNPEPAPVVFPGTQPPAPQALGIPLTVDVVIGRYTGEKADKKVSSAPYTLALTAQPGARNSTNVANLRMGNRVPIPTTTFTPVSGDGKGVNPLTTFNYQDVGINIDCRASVRSDGRYEVFLSLEENSVAPPAEMPPGVQGVNLPIIRSVRLNDTVVVRDGEMKQFTVATDRVTGETVKIEVTVKAVK